MLFAVMVTDRWYPANGINQLLGLFPTLELAQKCQLMMCVEKHKINVSSCEEFKIVRLIQLDSGEIVEKLDLLKKYKI